MFTKTGEIKAAHEKWDDLFKKREYFQAQAKQETRAASLVENKHTSVANAERQAGNSLTTTKFAAKLRRVNPDLVLEPHPNRKTQPWNADKSCIYLSLPGKKEFLIVCEADWMPEWSVMDTKELRRPEAKTAWKSVRVPYHEVKRGWRTVLVRLIQKGIISLDAAEREFGAGERETWKILTGKGQGVLLI